MPGPDAAGTDRYAKRGSRKSILGLQDMMTGSSLTSSAAGWRRAARTGSRILTDGAMVITPEGVRWKR